MITLIVLAAFTGTNTERVKAITIAAIIDALYMIPSFILIH